MAVYYLATTEHLYLSLELGWIHKNINDRESVLREKHIGDSVIVLIGSGKKDTRVLLKFPPKSVWVYLYSDETVNFRQNLNVLKSNAVIGVLRPYSIKTKKFELKKMCESVFCALNELYLSRSKSLLLWNCLSLFLGFYFYAKNTLLLILHEYLRVINLDTYLGYTNLFGECLTNFRDAGKKESLIHQSLLDLRKPEERILEFQFVGQRGKLWRKYALAESEKLLESRIYMVVNKAFGGTKGANFASEDSARLFFSSARKARFSICPAGNYSGTTFRWMETLMSGSLPIQSFRVSPDFLTSKALYANKTCDWKSWRTLILDAGRISETERVQLIKECLQKVQRHNDSLNRYLAEHLMLRGK